MPLLDKDSFDVAWKIGSGIIALAVVIYSWFAQRGKATQQHIDEAKDGCDMKISDHEHRIIKIESHLKGMPTHNDLAKLYVEINDSNSKLDQMIGQNKGVVRDLDIIKQYLLDKDKT